MEYDKTFLRNRFISQRKRKYLTVKKFNFNLIFQLIRKNFDRKKITIAGYYPSNYEVNILEFFEIASRKRFKIVLPVIKSTIRNLCSRKNKVFLLSHFGRPKGKYSTQYSLKFLTEILAEILSVEQIHFVSSCYGEVVNQQKMLMQPGEICLLENLRFHKEETLAYI